MNTFQILDKDKIEKEAIKKFNSIKLKDDLYIIPEYVIKSNELSDANILNVNKEISKKVKISTVENGDSIITFVKEKKDNSNIVQIINLNNSETKEFIYEKELNEKAREEIINSIAYNYKNKEVIVSFYLSYNLQGLSILLENI